MCFRYLNIDILNREEGGSTFLIRHKIWGSLELGSRPQLRGWGTEGPPTPSEEFNIYMYFSVIPYFEGIISELFEKFSPYLAQ